MRRLRLAVLLTAFVPVLAVSAPAQGLSFSAGAGGLFPPAGQYREIYGPGLSLGGDIWLTLKGHFGFAAGFVSGSMIFNCSMTEPSIRRATTVQVFPRTWTSQ